MTLMGGIDDVTGYAV